MTALFSLLTAYYLCDATANARPMSPAEWQACNASYHALKLHFIEGVTPEDYDRLSAGERAAVAAAGYAAFKAWEAANPVTVRALRTG